MSNAYLIGLRDFDDEGWRYHRCKNIKELNEMLPTQFGGYPYDMRNRKILGYNKHAFRIFEITSKGENEWSEQKREKHASKYCKKETRRNKLRKIYMLEKELERLKKEFV